MSESDSVYVPNGSNGGMLTASSLDSSPNDDHDKNVYSNQGDDVTSRDKPQNGKIEGFKIDNILQSCDLKDVSFDNYCLLQKPEAVMYNAQQTTSSEDNRSMHSDTSSAQKGCSVGRNKEATLLDISYNHTERSEENLIENSSTVVEFPNLTMPSSDGTDRENKLALCNNFNVNFLTIRYNSEDSIPTTPQNTNNEEHAQPEEIPASAKNSAANEVVQQDTCEVSHAINTTCPLNLTENKSSKDSCSLRDLSSFVDSAVPSTSLTPFCAGNPSNSFIHKFRGTGPSSPKSSLKRPSAKYDEAPLCLKKMKKGISFDKVSVFYFPRTQGFTCVPSQGGSTLGMSWNHTYSRTFSLSVDPAEQRRLQKYCFDPSFPAKWNSSSNTSSDSDSDDVISEPEVDSESTENCFCLQPLKPRDRRAMLRAAGVQRIDSREKDECRVIRLSREYCGCTCPSYCNPETCACAQAEIKCQVDRMNFPCSCTRDGCLNPAGRIEFNPIRVRSHYVQTLMRLAFENRETVPQPQRSVEYPPVNIPCLQPPDFINYAYQSTFQPYMQEPSQNPNNYCNQYLSPSSAMAYLHSITSAQPKTSLNAITYPEQQCSYQDAEPFNCTDSATDSAPSPEENSNHSVTDSESLDSETKDIEELNKDGKTVEEIEETKIEEDENLGEIIKKSMVESVSA